MKFKRYTLIVKPRIFKIGGVLYNSAQAIYPFIIIPGYILDNINDINYQSILEHEATHLDRARKLGVLKWYVSYLFSAKFRLKEEAIAYRIKKKFLESNGLSFDIEVHAKILSSNIYGKIVKYEEAVRLLST